MVLLKLYSLLTNRPSFTNCILLTEPYFCNFAPKSSTEIFKVFALKDHPSSWREGKKPNIFLYLSGSTATINIILFKHLLSNMKKLKVGFFSFTGDEGCMIEFLEILNNKFKEWSKLLDIRYCRLLKSKNKMKGLDVAFVEGAVATYREEKNLKEIRKNAKRVVAIGSCAIDGSPSNLRNYFDKEKTKEIKHILDNFGHRKKVLPLKDFVKVDEDVEGCPMIEEKFIRVLNKYLKEFKVV